MQVSLLLEAETFAGRVQGGAESWADQMETLLTEELDGRLRAHRPRAGRIEEEVSRGDWWPACWSCVHRGLAAD